MDPYFKFCFTTCSVTSSVNFAFSQDQKVLSIIYNGDPVADPRGASSARPPSAQNFLSFMQNRMSVPPRGLAPPPTGNPGSSKVQNLLKLLQGVNDGNKRESLPTQEHP